MIIPAKYCCVQLFYSMIQGVLYILCYRMKDIMDETGNASLPMAELLK